MTLVEGVVELPVVTANASFGSVISRPDSSVTVAEICELGDTLMRTVLLPPRMFFARHRESRTSVADPKVVVATWV